MQSQQLNFFTKHNTAIPSTYMSFRRLIVEVTAVVVLIVDV